MSYKIYGAVRGMYLKKGKNGNYVLAIPRKPQMMAGTKLVVSIPGILVGLTIIYCIFFPADRLNIKEIILASALFVSVPYIYRYIRKRDNLRLTFFSIIYPAITTLLSITVGDSSINAALSFGYVWIYLLLIPVIDDLQLDIRKPFVFGTIGVALIVNFIFLTDLFGIISIYSNPVLKFFYNLREVQWGKGPLATFGYSIFYKTSPLILFTLGYMLHTKRYIWSIILFVAIIGSGTRANLLAGLFVFILVPLTETSRKSLKRIVVLVLIIVSVAYFGPILFDRLSKLNHLKFNRSEAVKLGAIYSIFDHLNQAPYRYIFGSGVGSYFYSSGRDAYVSVVEVSFFDYFRQVGVLGFSFFLYFILYPIKWLFKNERWLLICYLGYLAVAATNPLLVTSTSFMAYVLILSNGMGRERVSLMNSKKLSSYFEK